MSTKEILGKQIIFSGGGYFRLASYYLLHLSNLSKLHCIRFARTFKSYVGLKGAPEKLRQYLKDFKFTDVRSAAEMIEWSKVPVVEL